MKRAMSPFFSPFLLFFLFVTAVFIVVNGKTELESNADDTSILVEQKSSDVNSANDSLKHVRDIEEKKTEEEDDEEDDGDGDGDNDGDEEKEEEEEDASGEIQEEEEEEEEEYEGEERNEYEDELKALAESHEAMSKDETKDETRDERTNSNTNNSTAAKNFESHENVLENKSDEDVASNEAITDELPKKHEDKEVADLLRYKKEKDLRQKEKDGLRKKKKKRVPTVKKELSTQKEILLAGNETQVLKSLVPSEETFNGLNEETEQVKRGYFGENERAKDKRMSIIQEDSYWNMSNEIPEKFDNRQDISAKNFRSYILKKCREEQENEEKLHESKDQKDNLVKCLLKFKKKLAKDLERWDKVHQFLMKVKAGLNYSKNMQDIEKKNYDGPLTTSSTVTEASQDEKERKKTKKKKKKKKKMKKKKKLQDRRSTMTTTTKVVTFPSTTTTMSPSTTTSVQWQLLAEKLFGPPWQENVRPESDDIAKIRYSVDSKPRTITSSSIRRFIDQQDATNNRKELNKKLNKKTRERQPLLLQKAHQLPGKSNLFPFEKINTHRNRFDSQIDRLGEYNGPERVLQRLRFGQIIPPPRDFSREKDQEDYQDDDGQREEEITHNREHRPPNQNFAMSRSWPDIPLKYNNRPWKGDRWDGPNGRTKPSSLPNEWSWKQPQYNNNFWPARGRTWQSIRNYWTPLDNDYEEESNFVSKNRVDRNWRWRESQERRQRQRQEQEQEEDEDEGRFSYPWELEGPNVWPGSQSFQVKSPWSQTESSQISKTHDNIERKIIATPWEDTKIRPYESPKSTTKMARQYGKSKVSLPKISMATWNSLTSDPATWPYRSSDTKPWPKDENGKSYNPNADLVKKLGLDKDDGTIWQNEETVKTYKIPNDQWDPLQTNSKNSSNQENESIKRYKLPKDRFDFDIYDVKSKSMKDWTKPRSKENRQFEPLNDDVNNWYRDNEPKTMWSTKDALNSNLPKIQSVGAWDMPPDKSTWMPYRFEPQSDPFNENPTGPTIRRWFESNGSSSSIPNYAKPINGVELWSPKSKNVDLWNREYDLSQDESNISDRGSSRSNKVINWPFKSENDYSNKENYALWDRKRSFDKGQPENVDLGKGNHDVSSNDVPSLKANETNNGIDSSKETLSLHKPNNWNNTYERANSWPSKWKQFSYHRVTTLPISKPGTVSNISTKSRNAFVAVSAVASPKHAISKNDIVESQNNQRDLFEKQLEDLRQQNSWSLKANAIEESIRSPTPTERLTIESTIGPTLTNITNFTSMVHRPEEEKLPKSANKEYQMHNK
ncbi:trichohyalin-like [Vespula pensylvanica]|uniref:trichohyalin-like n=1 Tax=Vespula pensylvanica TaxID=30213 RepID=UPI001CBA2C37|nr:trichohyalin-like [Vespula pensylvanica]